MNASAIPREATATIRGYIYQFDATIRKLLVLPGDATLTIEGVEDFDQSTSLGSEYSQIKYYAAQKLTNNVLRDALLPMLKGFISLDSSQRAVTTYILYGYFKENCGGSVELDLEYMKRILTKGHFEDVEGKRKLVPVNLQDELNVCDDDLIHFAKLTKIIVAEQYDIHKNLVVQELKRALNVSKLEAEAFSYPSALAFVSEIASKSQRDHRVLSRQQFVDAIRPSVALYSEWTLREVGEAAYCKKMRATHFAALNIDFQERFFIISDASNFTLAQVQDVAKHIVEKWSTYNSRTKPTKERFAPYLLFPGISAQSLVDVKQSFVDDGILIVDGFTFFGSSLDLYALQEPQTRQRPIAARFLCSYEQMISLISTIRTKKLIVQFYITAQQPILPGYRQIVVPINSLEMIKAIL